MPTIAVGSKTLTIPAGIATVCAEHIKSWYNLSGDTPTEILDAWSDHVIEELKAYLVEQIGGVAFNSSMTDSRVAAEADRDAAEASADTDLVIA